MIINLAGNALVVIVKAQFINTICSVLIIYENINCKIQDTYGLFERIQ